MNKLINCKKGTLCSIANITGDGRFISRVSSIGLTVGAEIQILRNSFGMPMLIYSHDTVIVISKKEAVNIFINKKCEVSCPVT